MTGEEGERLIDFDKVQTVQPQLNRFPSQTESTGLSGVITILHNIFLKDFCYTVAGFFFYHIPSH